MATIYSYWKSLVGMQIQEFGNLGIEGLKI